MRGTQVQEGTGHKGGIAPQGRTFIAAHSGFIAGSALAAITHGTPQALQAGHCTSSHNTLYARVLDAHPGRHKA